MVGICFKKKEIKLSEDGQRIDIPVDYLKQLGKFLEKTEEDFRNPDSEFAFNLSNINIVIRMIKVLIGREYKDWEDPLKTEQFLIKHCPKHWWNWTLRHYDGD